MKLTIGMIVKNEERYLRRCLEAIAPILQQVDSELIIADTGSTDHTVEIAKEFTDNVFFFNWINDFSAARNAVLDKAKGEWHMSVDADEIFEDVSEIISFFNSGEYKNYTSASYIQRSANDRALKEYSDLHVTRMAKIYGDTRYVNAIHEFINPIRQPSKDFSAIALHYGYIIEDNKQAISQKTDQYIEILLTELRKDPEDSKHYYDICNAYFLAGDLDKALEYCGAGIKRARKQKSIILYPLYFNKALIYYRSLKYKETLGVIDEYFQSKNQQLAHDLEMHCLSGHVYSATGQYRESIASFEKYIKFLGEYKQGRFQGPDIMVYTENSVKDAAYRSAVLLMIRACIQLNDHKAAAGYLKNLSEENWYQDEESTGLLIELELNVMKSLSDFARLPLLYGRLNKAGLHILQERLEQALHDEQLRRPILAVLAALNAGSAYIELMKLRYGYLNGSLTSKAVEEFIASVEEWTPVYADVLYFAVYINCSAKLIAEKIDLFNLEYYLFNQYLHFKDLPVQVSKICTYISETEDAVTNLWCLLLIYSVLPFGQLDDADVIIMCQSYAKAAYSYVQAVYREHIIEEDNLSLIPKSIRVGYYLHISLSAESNAQKIDYLRSAAKLYPQIAKEVKIVLSDMQQRANEAKHVDKASEFDRYASIVKSNIITLIDQGKIDAALQLISQYEQLCPADAELAEVKKRLIP